MKYFLLVSVLLLPAVLFAAEAGQPFIPLTSLPGLMDGGNASNMSAFLNNLYKICIGAAAAIAVLQIVRAGILFMTNKGSVSENEQAKDLVRGSVLGLILVLSPVIVFTIINPKILTLDFGVDALKQNNPAQGNLGSSITEGALSSIANSIATACSITVDPSEKTCIDSAAVQLQSQYMSCVTAANGDPAKQSSCGTALTNGGKKAATDCIDPDPSGSDLTCIGNEINKNVQIVNGGVPQTTVAYGWIAKFLQNASCSGDTCPTTTLKGGPFATEALCDADFKKKMEASPPFVSAQCQCNKTIAQQGSACPIP